MERTGETNSRAGVPWALRGMVIASVALPLLVFACGAWFDWRAIKHAATDSLVNQLSVACEQATRVLDTHMLLGARVNDLVGGLGDDAISEREHELHDRLIAMIAGMSQVSAVAITGSDGQPLIATSQYPVDHSVSFNNQPYFKAIRDTRASYFIGGVIPGRLTGANEFVVASRRGSDPDQFSGVIIVGVLPSYSEILIAKCLAVVANIPLA